MNIEVQPRSIELAETPPFRVGGLDVRPATLEVVAEDGRREMLEPRVMQVLVALAVRRGELVSRDELNARCWGGRVVGDDALQRCVSRLRKLGREHQAFEIDSVRRVGVRLVEAGDSPRRRRWPPGRFILVGSLLLALAAAVAAGWWHMQRPGTRVPSVAVGSFRTLDRDEAGRASADRIADDIRGVLGESLPGARMEDGPSHGGTDLTVGGVVRRDGDTLRVRATLTYRDGSIIWSRDYARPIAQEEPLRDLVTVGAVESVFSAIEALQQPVDLDPETLALYVRRSELATTGDPTRPGEADRALEQILDRAPKMGAARGVVALHMKFRLTAVQPEERAALRRRIHQEIDRAIRDSPHAGVAYDALYQMTREFDAPGDLVAAEDVLLKGLADAPNTPFINMRECRFLGEVGRLGRARFYCERALALRPLASPLAAPYAAALYAVGDTAGAQDAVARYTRYHPDHYGLKIVRFDMALFEGELDEAERLLGTPDTAPYGRDDETRGALAMLIEALRTGRPAAADRAIAALRDAVHNQKMDPRYLIIGATQLGRLDDAFAAFAPGEPYLNYDWPCVFLPVMAPFRKDPRFWQIAAHTGYLRYWRTRKIWPDFCVGPNAELDCPAASARAGV